MTVLQPFASLIHFILDYISIRPPRPISVFGLCLLLSPLSFSVDHDWPTHSAKIRHALYIMFKIIHRSTDISQPFQLVTVFATLVKGCAKFTFLISSKGISWDVVTFFSVNFAFFTCQHYGKFRALFRISMAPITYRLTAIFLFLNKPLHNPVSPYLNSPIFCGIINSNIVLCAFYVVLKA